MTPATVTDYSPPVPRHTLAVRALVAVVAAAAALVPAGSAAAKAVADNAVTELVSCDLDTGLVHAQWRYTNVRGPASMVDASAAPPEWMPETTTDVPVGETVIATASFPIDVEQVTFTFTIASDGWSDTYSSPVAAYLCPPTQVELTYSYQCDTSLVVTMRNKPYSSHNVELTLQPVQSTGARLGPFVIAPGQKRSVTVPLPAVYVQVFEGSTLIGTNSGPRPTPCTSSAPAGPGAPATGGAGGPSGATATPTGVPATTTSAAESVTPETRTRTTTLPATLLADSSPPSSGWLPWVGGIVAIVMAGAGVIALLLRRRAQRVQTTPADGPESPPVIR